MEITAQDLHIKDIHHLKNFYKHIASKYADQEVDIRGHLLSIPFAKYSGHLGNSYLECLNVMERETVQLYR